MSYPLSRRAFLGVIGVSGLGVSGAALALGACSSNGGGSSGGSADGVAGAAFAAPEVLRSANGRLAVTLRAAPAQLPWGTTTRYALTYNGSSPGPTLVVAPGDELVITLENGLDEPTNLHTHGLHVSPGGDADNVFVMVAPGKSHTYTYAIPRTHRSGTFWYHPHHHGSVAPQVSGGLAGMIVVRDALDDLAAIAAADERVLVLADPRIGRDRGVLDASMMTRMQGRQGDAVLVNGLLQPDLGATTDRLQHWRIVNASASRYHRLALDGHPLHVLGTDGGRLAAPVERAEVLLAPGERVELLIAPTAPGRHVLRARAYDRGSSGMGGGMMGGGSNGRTSDVALATLVVAAGTSAGAALPATVADAATVAPVPAPTATRTLTLAMGMGGGMGGGMSFTIDGRSFDDARTDIRIAAGTVEEWTIRNTSGMDHPFHLHVWAFQVVEPAGVGGWKDTVSVPANGQVRIRIPFTGLTGRTVYHCHILDHEDLGMMGVIEVA